MPRAVYLFIHVPKTGGSTINRHLRTHLEFDNEFVHLGAWGNSFREANDLPPWRERTGVERARARVLAGHEVTVGDHDQVPGAEARYLTILRDPADRILSAYNFQMHQQQTYEPFWEWYESYPRNNAYKWLKRAFGLEGDLPPSAVMERLDRLWFVGVTEHLDDDLPHLFHKIGVPQRWVDQRRTLAESDDDAVPTAQRGPMVRYLGNVVGRQLEMTDELRERLWDLNKRDLKLYRHAREVRERTRPNLLAPEPAPPPPRPDPDAGEVICVLVNMGPGLHTGGLVDHPDFDRRHVCLGPLGDLHRVRNRQAPFPARPLRERRRAALFWGERVAMGTHELAGKPGRYLAVLREPAERLLAHYTRTLETAPDTPFEPWAEEFPRNHVASVLRAKLGLEPEAPLADVERLLRTLWFVGVADHLEDDMPAIAAELGVSPVDLTPPDPRPDDPPTLVADEALREWWWERNPEDAGLYRLAVELRRATLPNLMGGV